MIAKKVPNRKKTASKSERIGRLADYIREPKRGNEKCAYAGARGFLTEDPNSQAAEMIALAQEAVRSGDPINHYVLSWPEGERPSPGQVEEAVTIFMDELGLADHQVIYGLHADTDNMHLHLAVNRVHPETGHPVKINKGFDIEAAHQAVARIEHAQGWQREQHGRYQVQDDGKVARAEPANPDKPRQPTTRQRDQENRTGEKSAARLAIEEGAPIIKAARSWEQLHRELADKGMRYERTGSGATVFVGDVAVKASTVDRNASLAKLQARLGKYQHPLSATPTQAGRHPARMPEGTPPAKQRAPVPIKEDLPGWQNYITQRRAHYEQKTAAKAALDKQHAADRAALALQQRNRKAELFAGDWKGRGDLLNALRSVAAAEAAAAKAKLKEQHRRQREQYRQQFRPFPTYEQWLIAQQQPDQAKQYRYRNQPARIEGDHHVPPTPRDIRAFQAEIRANNQVHYIRQGKRDSSFVDVGKRVNLTDSRDRGAVLAALQLSAQKWGRFTITGSADYKQLCVELAAEHGIRGIMNPELQADLKKSREARAPQQPAKPTTQPQASHQEQDMSDQDQDKRREMISDRVHRIIDDTMDSIDQITTDRDRPSVYASRARQWATAEVEAEQGKHTNTPQPQASQQARTEPGQASRSGLDTPQPRATQPAHQARASGAARTSPGARAPDDFLAIIDNAITRLESAGASKAVDDRWEDNAIKLMETAKNEIRSGDIKGALESIHFAAEMESYEPGYPEKSHRICTQAEREFTEKRDQERAQTRAQPKGKSRGR